jgi:hypothetical protein
VIVFWWSQIAIALTFINLFGKAYLLGIERKKMADCLLELDTVFSDRIIAGILV